MNLLKMLKELYRLIHSIHVLRSNFLCGPLALMSRMFATGFRDRVQSQGKSYEGLKKLRLA